MPSEREPHASREGRNGAAFEGCAATVVRGANRCLLYTKNVVSCQKSLISVSGRFSIKQTIDYAWLGRCAGRATSFGREVVSRDTRRDNTITPCRNGVVFQPSSR